jgi:MarR-like DNA-binding transcriptional regulator SgrR of sgrS sRNA
MTYSDETILAGALFVHYKRNRIRDLSFQRTDRGKAEVSVEKQQPITAPQLADVVGCSTETARRRLRDFSDRGILKLEKLEGRTNKYHLAVETFKAQRIIGD